MSKLSLRSSKAASALEPELRCVKRLTAARSFFFTVSVGDHQSINAKVVHSEAAEEDGPDAPSSAVEQSKQAQKSSLDGLTSQHDAA